MPKEFKEIRLFNKGTIRNIDETDASDESASFSLNLDPNTENGTLQGKQDDGIVINTGKDDSGTAINPALNASHRADISQGKTSKGDVAAVINDDGVYDAIVYDNNVIKELRNVFRGQGSSDSSTNVSVETVRDGTYVNSSNNVVAGTNNSALTNSSDTTAMEVNNKAVHIGMSDGDSKWVGVIKHAQFGHHQSYDLDGGVDGEAGTTGGLFHPVIQDAALKAPLAFPEFQWVVHSDSGWIYAAEWQGNYVYRFRYNESDDSYSFLGKSATRFNTINGIAARKRRSGALEPGVWVYDSGAGLYGTVYEYLTESADKIINTHQVSVVYYQGTTEDKFFDKSKVGGICESYHSTGGSGYLFFSKWLENESIIDPLDSETTSNSTTTSDYLQSSFLWRTNEQTQNISSNEALVLHNSTPHLTSDLKVAKTAGFKGFENIYVTNPANTSTDANDGTGVGGSGMLQGAAGSIGAADYYLMNSGYSTGKMFGQQSSTGELIPEGGDSSTNTITPKWWHLKGDPYPSTPWHSTGYNGSGSTDRKFTEEEQRKDSVGLLFGYYQNADGSTNVTAGVAVTGYNKGKGFFTDSASEDTNLDKKGYEKNRFGNVNALATTAHNSTTDANVDLRATGHIYCGSDPDNANASILNSAGGGLHAAADLNEQEDQPGVYYIDTYEKLLFCSAGYKLYCYSYNNQGVLTEKSTIDMQNSSGGSSAWDTSSDISEYNNLFSGGAGIDTEQKLFVIGANAGAHIAAITYDSQGTMTILNNPTINGNMNTYFHSSGDEGERILDIALCSFTGQAFIMAHSQTITANEGLIIRNAYSNTTGLPNFVSGHSEGTTTGTIVRQSVHNWDVDATNQGPGYVTCHLDNTQLDWNDDSKKGLFFYTSNGDSGGSNGNQFVSCVTYDNTGQWNFGSIKDLDTGGAGGALGFKIDTLNKVIYGANKYMGTWTAKYDMNGNMKIISSITDSNYAWNSVSGVINPGSGSGENVEWNPGAPGNDTPDIAPEGGGGQGARAVQVLPINTYHASLGLDDSYCTSAMLFTAFTCDHADDARKTAIVGAVYNWQAHHIEVPKNALYMGDIDNYQPIIIRTNGYSWNNSGHIQQTGHNDDGHGSADGGCNGNMVGFNDNDVDHVRPTTWSLLNVPAGVDVNATTKTLINSTAIPIPGTSTNLSYFALREDLTGSTDTAMKDRSNFVWATPYSAALVEIDEDNGITALAITCGNPGQNDVNSVLLYDKPALGNDLSNDPVGKVGIAYNESNYDLVNKLPSMRVIGNGSLNNSAYAVNKGAMNLFAGEVTGKWFTLGITEATPNTLDTLTEKLPNLVQFELELDTDGKGYQTSTVGDVFYKASFLYDGYQESPLGEAISIHLTENSDIKVSVLVDDAEKLQRYYARVTHIRVYRATNAEHSDSNPQPLGYYRLVEQLKLDGGIFGPKTGESTKWQAIITDNNQVSASYESNTGIPEVITDTSMKYGLSTQVNNMHIIGKASNSLDPDITDNMLFKSRPYNFDQFNVVTDRLMLPFTPTAIKAFNGRIYAFDKNQTCRIEPNQFYIEDIYVGAGCISPKTVLVTEYGMFYCDENNIYMHNGNKPTIISEPIQGGTYAWNSSARQSENDYEMIAYDGRNKTVLFYFTTRDSLTTNTELVIDSGTSNMHSYAWGYNITNQRWDLMYVGQHYNNDAKSPICSILSPNGYANVIDTDGINIIGGHTTNRKNWWWHSKDMDFGARTLTKKLGRVKIDGTGSSLGGSIGASETSSHPSASSDERVIIEKDGVENETAANYTAISQVSGETKFKLSGANGNGKRFKIKLENQDKAKKVSGIGLVYRIKGYR